MANMAVKGLKLKMFENVVGAMSLRRSENNAV